MTLLEKDPANRYPDAGALVQDLSRCIAADSVKGTDIVSFSRARPARFDELLFQKIFYGRSVETKVLAQGLERAGHRDGAAVFVCGSPGIGKTSLVMSFIRRHHQSTAITGRFEQLRQDEPYHGIILGLGHLIRNILALPAAELHAIKTRLCKAVKGHGQVILDLVPQAKAVIGPQGQLPHLTSRLSKARLFDTLVCFFSALADDSAPAILFMDDLQWADHASLEFFRHLLSCPGMGHLLFVGAFRDKEGDFSQALGQLTRECPVSSGSTLIRLGPLQITDIQQMVWGFLSDPGKQATALARTIEQKTHGNPFFIQIFLKQLCEKKILVPCEGGLRFRQALKDLAGVTDNVVAFIQQRLHTLDPEEQDFLALLSCFGRQARIGELAGVYTIRPDRIHVYAASLVEQGILVRDGENLSFCHNRFKDVCYSRIPGEQRWRLHHKIGAFLRKKVTMEDIGPNVFAILQHLNPARSLVKDEHELFDLARLNLIAGQRAQTRAAYEAAHDYFQTGIKIAGDSAWEKAYQLVLDLYTCAGQTAYLINDPVSADTLLDLAMERAVTDSDRVRIYEIRIVHFTVFNEPGKGPGPNLAAVMKAAQSIAAETRLGPLMEKLMAVVLENASAGKGVLVLNRKDRWCIEVGVSVNGVLDIAGQPLEAATALPAGLVRYVCRTGLPLVFHDAVNEARSFQDTYVREHMPKSVLCLPLVCNKMVAGALYLENSTFEGMFTRQRVAVLETVAKILANARAASLARARVLLYQDRLRDMSCELFQTRHRQRRRIALALHDRIGQDLSHAVAALKDLRKNENHNINGHINGITKIMEQTLRDTRTMTFELSPPILYDQGLGPALSWLAEKTQNKYGRPVTCRVDQRATGIPRDLTVFVFQIVTELLFNAVKHARADRAWLDLTMTGKKLKLIVRDNGQGFDPDFKPDKPDDTGGYGLFSIKERLISRGGTMDIKSAQGRGGAAFTLACPLE